ncbi:uncharacterized protein K460DRAFT_371451 [Cucurbitaria berberidis CBS 394.84]|uniref:F-box domain-containing protein n=1 Tax=Cucurbitaria berberidis CBS 394.84 TaxID=1168544 RepID=A0A9P4L3D1_9PLEO|nr:uncharacterized protein K460DRAFT_371451 [Cucurbitaria berberidis CBS 394.84]KAF1840245.1 hypothetical protein K460DRAFT_371451 [Cucurbitaria berberidis CBS 394.84]
MAPSPFRSSYSPHHHSRMAHEGRFSVTDAVHLKLRLQALDNALSSPPLKPQSRGDVDKIARACEARPRHEAVYVDGSEEFYLLVKPISRPDLIPDVYIEAYRAVLQGRPYLNEYKVSDSKQGVDPTFSKIRSWLPSIDALCETDLGASFSSLEDQVKPFPFLQLPAELRLHVYSHLLPRKPYISLPSLPQLNDRAPLRLDIMRASNQLHNEVAKYWYEKRTLFMVVARDVPKYMSQYDKTLARMPPQTRQLFNKIEIQVGYDATHSFAPSRYTEIRSFSDCMRHILALIPNLDVAVISFQDTGYTLAPTFHITKGTTEIAQWLVKIIPRSVQIHWDVIPSIPSSHRVEDQPMWQAVQSRGLIKTGESVFTRVKCVGDV